MSGQFGAQSTTDEVLDRIDLKDKRALVTGVSSGLGTETARALAAHGAHVIGAARDLAKAREAVEPILDQATANGGSIQLVELDLASLKSVRACADAILAKGEPLDLIIANAGVMACPKGVTADGFETQLGTNHLGHFVLVNRLAPLLREGGRMVSLTSAGHRFGDIDLDDPNFERKPYSELAAYGAAKTANVLFAVEFDRRHQARGVRACAVHPGGIATGITRHFNKGIMKELMGMIEAGKNDDAPNVDWKTIPQGAATSVWAAVTAPAELVGGRYCQDCHIDEIDDSADIRFGVRSYAVDPERAKAVWAKSEEMVGERF